MKVVVLKFRYSKVNNTKKLTDQVLKVVAYLANRYGYDPKLTKTQIGLVNDDFLMNKYTIKITLLNA